MVSLGFGSNVEDVLRAVFLLSESVTLTLLDSRMYSSIEYNEISLKFLCFKELRERYRDGTDVCCPVWEIRL